MSSAAHDDNPKHQDKETTPRPPPEPPPSIKRPNSKTVATTGTCLVTAPPENVSPPVPKESQPTIDPLELPGQSESTDCKTEFSCASRNHIPELQPTSKLTGHDKNPLSNPATRFHDHRELTLLASLSGQDSAPRHKAYD
jgi:hypothetical protein